MYFKRGVDVKHSVKVTAQLIAWSALAVIVGLLLIPFQEKPLQDEVSPWILAGIVIGAILGGAIFWYFAMKNFKPETIDVVFAAGIGLFINSMSSDVFRQYVPYLWLRMIIGGVVTVIVYITYLTIVRMMQTSWEMTQKLMPYSNIIMVAVMAGAGATIGTMVPPLAMFAVLGVAAIYDAWAVWHSGTMQKMAKFFLGRRVVPGLAVAKKTEEEGFALLGGGDIFFIVAMAGSLWAYSPFMTYMAAAWMFGAVFVLFLISSRGKYYPAIPFIYGGMICAYLTEVVRLAIVAWT